MHSCLGLWPHALTCWWHCSSASKSGSKQTGRETGNKKTCQFDSCNVAVCWLVQLLCPPEAAAIAARGGCCRADTLDKVANPHRGDCSTTQAIEFSAIQDMACTFCCSWLHHL
jgi:hypothetical protein